MSLLSYSTAVRVYVIYKHLSAVVIFICLYSTDMYADKLYIIYAILLFNIVRPNHSGRTTVRNA